METRLARIISYILHPLLIPTYAMVVLYQLPMYITLPLTAGAKLWLLGLVFTFTFVVPIAAIALLYFLGIVDSLELEKPSQRTIPLMVTSLSFLTMNYLMKDTGMPDYLNYFLYGSLFTLMLGLLVNLFYKISLHTLAWGAAAAAFAGISIRMFLGIPNVVAIAVLLAGVVGWARLKLNAHNPSQVYLGFVAGAAVIAILTFVL